MGGAGLAQLLEAMRMVEETVNAVVGVEAVRQRQLSAAQKLANYGASGSLEAGAGPGLVNLAA